MDKKNIKLVRGVLMNEGNTKFTVKGQTEYGKKEDGSYGYVNKIFHTGKNWESIWSDHRGMNVTKWGPTCVTLYTFDMLGKKAIGKIRYSDVRFIA